MDSASHAAAPAPVAVAAGARLGLPYGWLTLLGVIGLLLRVCLALLAPWHGYTQDHDDFVRWGILAADRGIASVYTERAPLHPQIRYKNDGTTALRERWRRRILNYPPLSAYVFWGLGHVHARLDAQRYVNSPTARLLYAIPNVIADLLMALACLKIVQWLLAGGERRSDDEAATPVAQPAAASSSWPAWALLFHPFVLCWLAPPIMIDSAMWGQNDAWLMAASAWMVWAMLQGRWWLAGLFYGVALACKPLAIFLLPVWGYALLFRRGRVHILGGFVTALALLNLLALPFWLTSGARWFEESYASHFSRGGEATTLCAFNIWYVDALLRESRDAADVLWGLPRSQWGLILLGMAGLLIAFSHRWLLRSSRLELVVVAGSILLAVATFPTGMHERYALLCFPFLIAAAASARRGLWLALMIWMLAGTLQVTWCNWASTLAGKEYAALQKDHADAQATAARDGSEVDRDAWEERLQTMARRRARDRPLEWLTTVLSLLGTALYFASLPTAAASPGLRAAPRICPGQSADAAGPS